MMTEPRSRGGRPPTVSDDEIRKLRDQGLSNAAIGKQLGLTGSAIGQRLKKMADRDAEQSNRRLPWTIRDAHSTGWVYKAVVGYQKRRRGEGLSVRELREQAELEDFLHRQDAVLGYDYSRGFYLRARRPEDGPSMLVKD